MPLPGHEPFTIFPNSKGPRQTRSQGSSGQQQLGQGLLILSPGLPFSLTFWWTKSSPPWLASVSLTFAFQWANNSPVLPYSFPAAFLGSQSRARLRLSPVTTSTLNLSLFTVTSINKCSIKVTQTRIVKSFPHKVKNPHTTDMFIGQK